MPIAVECECGKQFKAPDQAAGKKVRCPACGTILDAPNAPAPATGVSPAAGPPPRPFPAKPPAAPPPKPPAPPPQPVLELDDDPIPEARPAKKPGRGAPPRKKPVDERDEDELPARRPGRRKTRDAADRSDPPRSSHGLLFKVLILGAIGLVGCAALGGALAYVTYVLNTDDSGAGDK